MSQIVVVSKGTYRSAISHQSIENPTSQRFCRLSRSSTKFCQRQTLPWYREFGLVEHSLYNVSRLGLAISLACPGFVRALKSQLERCSLRLSKWLLQAEFSSWARSPKWLRSTFLGYFMCPGSSIFCWRNRWAESVLNCPCQLWLVSFRGCWSRHCRFCFGGCKWFEAVLLYHHLDGRAGRCSSRCTFRCAIQN